MILTLLVGFGLLMQLCAAIAAPTGYEDHAGFHLEPARAKPRQLPRG